MTLRKYLITKYRLTLEALNEDGTVLASREFTLHPWGTEPHYYALTVGSRGDVDPGLAEVLKRELRELERSRADVLTMLEREEKGGTNGTKEHNCGR